MAADAGDDAKITTSGESVAHEDLDVWCDVEFGGNLPPTLKARVLAVQSAVSVAFFAFILFTSNPFLRLQFPPFDGQDLNPLLQDPGLAFHPPFLYLGYVGLSISFSFAVAALIEGRVDAAWGRWVRPWTLLAWLNLTIGIALGSWWAYYELGWGGFWFWDPVENASFMPWLVGTALMHSLAVTEKRGAFKAWTVLLAIFAFSLSLLGTFLVRSGVLTSVHAFASDPERGVFILMFLMAVVGGSLALYAIRAAQIKSSVRFELLSRETGLLLNNVLLVVAAASVLLGTLYPLAVDALNLGKISVGPPYFNAVFIPLTAPLAVLVGIGMLARWKRDTFANLWPKLRVAAILSLVLGLAYPAVLATLATLFASALSTWLDAEASVSADRVRIAVVNRGDLIRDLNVQGRVVAAVSPTMYSPATGTVTLEVQPGDAVENGQALAMIDELTGRTRTDVKAMAAKAMAKMTIKAVAAAEGRLLPVSMIPS